MENTDTGYLNKLQSYWAENLAFPSMAKLCPVVGLTSTASVFEMVGRLVESGYLQRIEGRIAPTPKFFARPSLSFQGRQVIVGSEAPPFTLRDPHSSFLLQVPNDLLSHRHLLTDDLLVMHRRLTASIGGIALVQSVDALHFGQVVGLDAQQRPLLKVVYESEAHFCSVDGQPETGVMGVAIAMLRRFDRPTSTGALMGTTSKL